MDSNQAGEKKVPKTGQKPELGSEVHLIANVSPLRITVCGSRLYGLERRMLKGVTLSSWPRANIAWR